MTPDQRRQMVIMFEGQALHGAGHHGVDEQGEHVRCLLDGAANALMRMEGPEDAATFCFALTDRVVGRMRTPTEVKLSPRVIETVTVRIVERWTWPAPELLYAIGLAIGYLVGRGP